MWAAAWHKEADTQIMAPWPERLTRATCPRAEALVVGIGRTRQEIGRA
ncbi:hypothetical protein I546_3864 [Mycobacterium kansasii 732]|nr:hypothetical protein I546_3864 [Mycobacterium kansasii 732]